MKAKILTLAVAALCVAPLAAGAQNSDAGAKDREAGLTHTKAEREYLARLGDCVACHTSDPNKPFAGGTSFHTPIGIMYATNITPDPTYGIGTYTLEEFTRAVRDGVRKDGGRLYPAMPYPSYTKISDDDIRGLYEYFMNDVAPLAVENKKNEIPWLISMRWPLGIWNTVFNDPGRYTPDATKSEEWNRGAYLVQSLGHCGTCHTPRGLVFAEKGLDEKSKDFLGGAVFEGWYSVPLTGPTGFTPEQLKADLRQGLSAHNAISGPMSLVVTNSTQHLTEKDMDSIVTYLMSLQTPAPAETTVARGARDYAEYCAMCHGPQGKGIPFVVPALAGNRLVVAEDPATTIKIVAYGGKSPATEARVPLTMPAYRSEMSDEQLAGILTFLRQSWGNQASPVTIKQVRKSLVEGY
ncbi:cytochrome c [Phaeovibrio sulfidiphilus]|uniref:Cytochrome c n=1 Tax=Phaeovibrio sulfidiphilus TaxID=1220600 RepID=A0A8J7CPL2_9PROT|nr:cytochrome c [Phaeovibrio sulfidiphilus]MBE1237127.1 cytochrome c [Phaeovibrio sulfidiphilus]